jgi:hypothetical protein
MCAAWRVWINAAMYGRVSAWERHGHCMVCVIWPLTRRYRDCCTFFLHARCYVNKKTAPSAVHLHLVGISHLQYFTPRYKELTSFCLFGWAIVGFVVKQSPLSPSGLFTMRCCIWRKSQLTCTVDRNNTTLKNRRFPLSANRRTPWKGNQQLRVFLHALVWTS